MMNADIDAFIEFMEKQWPDKYTAEELASWAKTLQPWDLDEIRSACITHKENKRFKPYLREVKDILRELYPLKSTNAEKTVSRFKTVIATQWASTHPELRDEPEQWLIMRYYRYWFCRVKKSIDDVADARRAMNREPLPDDPSRLESLERSCQGNCKGDLIGSGLSVELATTSAAWVGSTELEFESYLNELENHLSASRAA